MKFEWGGYIKKKGLLNRSSGSFGDSLRSVNRASFHYGTYGQTWKCIQTRSQKHTDEILHDGLEFTRKVQIDTIIIHRFNSVHLPIGCTTPLHTQPPPTLPPHTHKCTHKHRSSSFCSQANKNQGRRLNELITKTSITQKSESGNVL